MKYRKIIVVGVVAAIIAACPLMAISGGFHRGGPGMGMGKGVMALLGSLDLTDAQKKGIAEILVNYRDVIGPTLDYLVNAKANLSAAIHADPMVEADVRAASGDVAYILEELNVLRAKAGAEIRPLLTADQIERLHELRTGRQEMMTERMGEIRERIDKMLEEWLALEP